MSTEIRILIAEDLPSDASLAEREILKVLPAATFKRVETKEAFISALEEYQPDLIVSDYQMPSFDGLTALKITLEKAPVTPFIIHTGSMNEDTAVACMKAGATDYVIKEHMKRLGPAVKNALANKKIKLAHIKAHRALVESEERFRRLAENADDLIYRIDFVPERRFSYVSPSATRIIGYTPEEHYADPDLGFKLVHPEDRKLLESMQHTVHDSIMSLTLRWQKKDGTVIWTEQKNVLIHDEEGKLQAIEGIARDITERKMAEAKLEKSEQMLTMAGKLAHLGGWSVDLIKNEMIWSDEVAAIHEMPAGFSPSVEEGINYYAPEYRERITKVYTDCVKDGVPYDEEMLIITGKGRKVWVRTIGFPIRNESGDIVSIDGAFQDISERKSAENALRESELKFRHLVQGGKDIIAMYDKQGRVLYNSPGAKEILGYEPEDAIGKSVFEIIHPDDMQKAQELLAGVISKPHGSSIRAEIRALNHDGSLRWLDATVTNMLNQPGVAAIVGNFRDITEERRARLIQQTQYKIAHAFLTAGGIKDLFESVRSELNHVLTTKNFIIAFYDEDNELFTAPYEIDEKTKLPPCWPAADSLTGLIVRQKKTLMLRKKDILKLAEQKKIVLRGERAEIWLGIPMIIRGKVIGVLVFQSYDDPNAFLKADIHILEILANEMSMFIEKKRSEEALVQAKEKAEESDRLKTAFLTNVSHEIRTPMNSILGFLELLKEPQLDDLKRASYMNNVSKSARRLLATITDIVEVSKLESGQSEILLQDVEVNQLMEKQYQLLKPEAEQKGIVMRWVDENQEESLHIQTDKQKLSSILTHLLNNAIKFTEQGYIELGKYLDSGYLVFFVKDTGVGVPVNKMEAIFERFVQADSAVTRGYEGSGLGLSIARAYLELLDGKIWVESEVGKGSTFYFSIPLTPHAQKDKAVSAQRRPPSEHPVRHTLLVAEDDDMSYVFLETILEDYALDLHRAVTGEEVIDLLKERPEASLILMDLKMPGMGGLAATREIRKFNTSIPIIAQTAHALTGDKATAINSGCDDYIAKPIKRKELIRMINQYAGGVLQKKQ